MMSGAANGMSTLAAPARSRRSSDRAPTGPINDAVALGANGARAVGPVAASLLVVAFGSYECVFWLLTDPSA